MTHPLGPPLLVWYGRGPLAVLAPPPKPKGTK
jgi:hypothetical protein